MRLYNSIFEHPPGSLQRSTLIFFQWAHLMPVWLWVGTKILWEKGKNEKSRWFDREIEFVRSVTGDWLQRRRWRCSGFWWRTASSPPSPQCRCCAAGGRYFKAPWSSESTISSPTTPTTISCKQFSFANHQKPYFGWKILDWMRCDPKESILEYIWGSRCWTGIENSSSLGKNWLW